MSLMRIAAHAHKGGVEAGPEGATAPERQVSSAERFEIAGELLAALDEATGAGQAHLMRRILGIIREEIRWPGLWLTGSWLATVVATMGDLDREVVRLAPDLGEFRRRTAGLIDLLSSTPMAAVSSRELGERRS